MSRRTTYRVEPVPGGVDLIVAEVRGRTLRSRPRHAWRWLRCRLGGHDWSTWGCDDEDGPGEEMEGGGFMPYCRRDSGPTEYGERTCRRRCGTWQQRYPSLDAPDVWRVAVGLPPLRAAVDEKLTDPGWPRPFVLVGGRPTPVPWVSPSDNMAAGALVRRQEMFENELCHVCGEGFDGRVVFFVNERPPDGWRDGKVVLPMTDALLHDRCARLALGSCPVLRSMRGGPELFAVSAPCEAVYVTDVDGTWRFVVGLERARLETDLASD